MADNALTDMRKQLVLSEMIEKRARDKAAQRELQILRQAKVMSDMLAPYIAKLPSKEKLKNVQYKHDVYDGITYAAIAPSNHLLHMAASQLMDGVTPGLIPFSLGVSYLNPEDGDVYNKKAGRIVAGSKLAPVSAKLLSASFNGEAAFFILEAHGNRYHFVLTHGKERPFLQHIYRKRYIKSYRDRLNEAKKVKDVAKKS